jgi:branched-chain amino acid transport system permease protein
VAVAISVVFKFTRWGLRARAVRDDALAAETSGINVLFSRMRPWIVSAFLTGAAGALWAHRLTAFSPKSFFIAQSVPIVVMTVLGGVNSVAGGLAGTVALTAWLELMRHVEAGRLGPLHFPSLVGIAELSLGVGLVLLLWRRPNGLLGSREVELAAGRGGGPGAVVDAGRISRATARTPEWEPPIPAESSLAAPAPSSPPEEEPPGSPRSPG